MKIIWKPVKGYEDKYLISSIGIVKSLERKVDGKVKGYSRINNARYLKPAFDGYGYLFVVLSDEGKHKVRKIHQLVSQSFIGDCPMGFQINHKNGIKIDNRPENLEYVTPKENTSHSINKLKHYRHGKYHWNAKLTTEKVTEIRTLYKTGKYTQIQLAKIYSIHRGQLSKICSYKSWV